MSAPLNITQARDVYARYARRRELFVDETEETAFLVVLLNYGDQLTAVSCIGGEWTGTKDETTVRTPGGIPLCPSGHPLLESPNRQRLGLVDERIG